MSWRRLGWVLVACVCSAPAPAQEQVSDTTSKNTSLDAVLGSLDALGAGFSLRMPGQEAVDSRLTVGMADSWQSGLAYRVLSCPHGSFPTRENAGVRIAYDDSRLWGTSFPSFTGLRPSATMGFETNDRWRDARAALDRGVYLQFGISPGYELQLPGKHPVVASLPVTLGLNSMYDEFARSTTPGFGYLDIGLTVSTPLSARSKHAGSWGLTAGVNFVFLGEGREAINGGDDFDVMASITLGFEF